MPHTPYYLPVLSVGHKLAGAFFLVILLGLLGYFQTVNAMQAGARRAQIREARVHACISLAKDVALSSHGTIAYTQLYVYTLDSDDWELKWETGNAADSGIQELQSQLQTLPNSANLVSACSLIALQNKNVCEPIEVRALALARKGRSQEARALIETQGKAEGDYLEMVVVK